MKKVIFFCIAVSMVFLAKAQESYSRAQIALGDKTGFHLQRLGLEIDHGHWEGHKYFSTDLSQREIALLEAAGYDYRILIPKVKEYYADQLGSENSRDGECNTSDQTTFDIPENFTLGSMAGYFTYEEMLATLDLMHEMYPDIISTRRVIADSSTHEARPIYWVRLSDNPDTNEDEPEILYTSLHHAREPMSLSQMIYQLWYLLENYETDARVKYLVEETEMYFIPCVNPDGYLYNESTNPDGGGLWRKNRRDNLDGTWVWI